jgi:hypothetical protein
MLIPCGFEDRFEKAINGHVDLNQECVAWLATSLTG